MTLSGPLCSITVAAVGQVGGMRKPCGNKRMWLLPTDLRKGRKTYWDEMYVEFCL